MSVSVVLLLSLCSMPSADAIKAKMRELEAKNPGAKVSVSVSKKCLK